jgi:hypothetical protein
VESLKEISLVLKESHGINPSKLHDSTLTILDVIGLKQHIDLFDPLPLTCNEKDEDNLNLLGYIQTIST